METARSDTELMELLKQFDTPSITNVVATYPDNRDTCLGLYDPWNCNWYTDTSLKCIYPELGRRVGHAVTVVFGLPNPAFDRLSLVDIFRAVAALDGPVVLCMKQDFPDRIKDKVGLAGGNFVTALKAVGCIGLISDGPSRDVDEIREMDFQYMLTGVTAGHGELAVKAINVPVTICGMDVAPGEVVHMDENGAVKFPRPRLAEVYECAVKLQEFERQRMANLSSAKDVDELVKIWQGK